MQQCHGSTSRELITRVQNYLASYEVLNRYEATLLLCKIIPWSKSSGKHSIPLSCIQVMLLGFPWQAYEPCWPIFQFFLMLLFFFVNIHTLPLDHQPHLHLRMCFPGWTLSSLRSFSARAPAFSVWLLHTGQECDTASGSSDHTGSRLWDRGLETVKIWGNIVNMSTKNL